MIAAPNMRTPLVISHTINTYLATKAVLLTVRKLNLESIVFPGIGTGTGRVSARSCAKQMAAAIYTVFVADQFLKRLPDVYEVQKHMFTKIASNEFLEIQFKR